MCGGGSDPNEQAAKDEAKRRAQVAATQKAIEAAYSSPKREADIGDLIAATRQFLQGDLNDKTGKAQRNLKFALARDGQTLGSTAVDQNRDLGKEYLRGALEVERRAQGAGSALRESDLDAKFGLFNQAVTGLDMTTAVQQAGQSMLASAGRARADALQGGLAGLFDDMGSIYQNSRERKGRADAEKYQYGGGSYYTPNSYYSGGWGGPAYDK
jgi:hypothetical protein